MTKKARRRQKKFKKSQKIELKELVININLLNYNVIYY